MSQVVFVIDLARCTGCQACQVACRDRAGLPDGFDLLRVEEREAGAYPQPELTYRVLHCFHCAEPPCAAACPTQALAKRQDDLVALDEDACTGCGACLDVCPFGAIVLLPQGLAAKCDGCPDELAQGWEPTCVRACPMRALAYRDDGKELGAPGLADRQRAQDATFQDHGAGASVVYLRRP